MFAVLWPQVNSGLVSPSSFPAKEERHFHAQKVTHISTPFTFSACSPVNSLPSLLSSQIIRIPFPLASAVLFTCGEAGRSMDHNWPLFVVCPLQSSQESIYRPEKHWVRASEFKSKGPGFDPRPQQGKLFFSFILISRKI